MGDFGFRGEFGGDLVFGAAQDEGGDFGGECVGALLVGLFFYRGAEGFLECCGVPEQAGHEEVKQAPKLAEVVLDGGAGEADAVLGVELSNSLRDLCRRVFDVLCLVED